MKAYLCAPMRGYPRYNFDAIDDAAEVLRSWSYKVWSPADHDRDNGFNPDLSLEDNDFDFGEAMEWDIRHVIKADAVVVLEGWERSAGAKVELTVARACDKDVYRYRHYDDGYAYLELVSDDELAAVLDGPDVDEIRKQAYRDGCKYGRECGDINGYKRGYEDGHDGGIGVGRSQGITEGYNRGYELGMSHGKALHNPGCHAKSYEVGYVDGGEDAKNRTVVAFNTIVDAINLAGDTLGFKVEDAADDFPLV